MVRALAVERDPRRAPQPAGIGQLRSERPRARAADLQLPDHRALGLEHLHAGGRQHDALVRQRVVAAEAYPQVGALNAVQRHAAVLGKPGRADGQRVDAAVDAAVGVVDQVEDRADVLAPAHVLTAFGAVDSGRGRHLGLALRAFDPLLGRLVAPYRRLGELLAVVAKVLDEAESRIEDRQRLGLLAQDDGREAFQVPVPLLDQLQLLGADPEAVFLHLELAVELLPVGDLERQADRRPAQPSRQERLPDPADDFHGLIGLDYGVGTVDAPLLLEDLPEQLGAAGGFQRGDLRRRGRARADADSEPAGLHLLARNIRVPEHEDVAGVGRAHVKQT